ncbi:MAG: metallophosphoesterase, partial [Bifidobacteriaceae bacterium]|nr:metallophosphoesterase [Bifidobacteriaceae bacterium]
MAKLSRTVTAAMALVCLLLPSLPRAASNAQQLRVTAASQPLLKPVLLTNSLTTQPTKWRRITWLLPTRPAWSAHRLQWRQSGQQAWQTSKATARKNRQPLAAYQTITVKLTGLAAGQRYEYRLAGRQNGSPTRYSTVHSFSTAPAQAADFHFLALADAQGSTAGYRKYWGNTLAKALKTVPDAAFVVQLGDLVDQVNTNQMTAWVKATGQQMASPAFNPILGNHDAGQAAGQMFSRLFPQTSVNSLPLNYAVRYSNVLLLCLNTNNTSLAKLRVQAKWIKREAAAWHKRW